MTFRFQCGDFALAHAERFRADRAALSRFAFAQFPVTPSRTASWPNTGTCSYTEPDHLWLRVHFSPTEISQAAGRAFLERLRLRTENRDPAANESVVPAQLAALAKWGVPQDNPYAFLSALSQPTLVVNGDNDVIIYTVNSLILRQHIPNAQLIIYPDANHGSLYQYPSVSWKTFPGSFLNR